MLWRHPSGEDYFVKSIAIKTLSKQIWNSYGGTHEGRLFSAKFSLDKFDKMQLTVLSKTGNCSGVNLVNAVLSDLAITLDRILNIGMDFER